MTLKSNNHQSPLEPICADLVPMAHRQAVTEHTGLATRKWQKWQLSEEELSHDFRMCHEVQSPLTLRQFMLI